MPVVDVATQTEGRPACLLVTTASGDIVTRSDPERCAKRLRPYSTFKIPSSLIALELGIVADASSVIPWNESVYPKQSWWPRGGRVASTTSDAINSTWRFEWVTTMLTKLGLCPPDSP